MAQIVKTIPFSNGGSWSGHITLTIDHDEIAGKATVSAKMYYYCTDSGNPREGYYRNFLQITKNGSRISSAGNDSVGGSFWLTDANAHPDPRLSCSATISYSESCTVGCNGWVICDSGALAGTAIQGSGSVTLTQLKPASPITTDKLEVQMGKNLLITLNRQDSSYLHKLSYTFGGKTEVIASNVGGSYGWTVPDLAAQCSNELTGVCTLTCETFVSSKSVGTTTALVTLRVPDATVPAIEGSAVTMGTVSTIGCKRNSGNFTLRLEYQFQGITEEIGETNTDSLLWTPGYDLAKQIPTLTYATGTLKCTTFNGTAEVGTETATIRAIVPENDVTKPSFTLEDLTLSPISELGEDFAGIYLRGKTGLKAEFDAGSGYSTLKEYRVTVGSVSAAGNPAAIPVLVNEGDVKVTAKVTDARGFTTTVSTNIEILPYRRPKVVPYAGYDQVICERALATGELSTKGTYLAVKAGKAFSSVVVDGTERNACVLRYRWKPSGSDNFSDWTTLLAEDSEDQQVSLLISDVCSSLSTSYVVELSAADTLEGENVLSFAIMTEAVSFVLYDGVDGAGFGKYPETPHVVDIASHMTLRVRGQMVVDHAAWNSLGFAEGIIESVYAYGRREDSGCSYLVEMGSHVHVAFNCAFSYGGTALVINATAIPESCRPKRPVLSLCPVNDRGIALVSVNPDGYIRVEWVQSIKDTVFTGSAEVTWIDGYLDYWME